MSQGGKPDTGKFHLFFLHTECKYTQGGKKTSANHVCSMAN